jgi:predicted heme/steroid binding protein
MNKFFLKLDRFAAWILMVVIIFYAVSGYGLTKGLINRDIALALHLTWLAGIGMAAFVIHTACGFFRFFCRKCIWNVWTKSFLIVFYALLAGFFVYVHFFYSAATQENNRPPLAGNQSALSAAVSSTISAGTTIFTAATLSAYDGRNGQPAYAAVDGIVYDVSSVYRNGDHHGYQAGIDLTADFYAQHSAALLSRYPIVGTYQK